LQIESENNLKMIDDKELYKLLLEKTSLLDKRINKLFNILMIIPFLYFLLKYSLITEIAIKSVKIDKVVLLLSVAPLIYSLVFLCSSFLESNKARIITFIVEKEDNNDDCKSRYLLSSFNLSEEISNIFDNKKRNSMLVNILIIYPFYLIMLLAPFSFWIYCLYNNFIYEGDFSIITKIFAILSIWILIASFFNYYHIEKDIYKL
jgi:hypothetical protein